MKWSEALTVDFYTTAPEKQGIIDFGIFNDEKFKSCHMMRAMYPHTIRSILTSVVEDSSNDKLRNLLDKEKSKTYYKYIVSDMVEDIEIHIKCEGVNGNKKIKWTSYQKLEEDDDDDDSKTMENIRITYIRSKPNTPFKWFIKWFCFWWCFDRVYEKVAVCDRCGLEVHKYHVKENGKYICNG